MWGSPARSGWVSPRRAISNSLSTFATASACTAGETDLPTALPLSILATLERDTFASMPVAWFFSAGLSSPAKAAARSLASWKVLACRRAV